MSANSALAWMWRDLDLHNLISLLINYFAEMKIRRTCLKPTTNSPLNIKVDKAYQAVSTNNIIMRYRTWDARAGGGGGSSITFYNTSGIPVLNARTKL
jgi:hypothetical protein